MLYVYVREFSFVKGKQQLHKMQVNQVKYKFLLKQKSSKLDQGH